MCVCDSRSARDVMTSLFPVARADRSINCSQVLSLAYFGKNVVMDLCTYGSKVATFTGGSSGSHINFLSLLANFYIN